MGAEAKFKRVLLKLSGEALMGDDAYGINRATIERIVGEIGQVAALGLELGVVIGGGNIFRGVAPGAQGMDRAAKTNDDIAFMRLDRELNRLMIEAAHNDYAARSMKLLQGLSRRFWYMHYREAADLPLCARLHANQARAIAQGKSDAAVRASAGTHRREIA